MPKVEIYTQPWCPYCVRAKSLLERKGVAYTEIEAPHGTAERAEIDPPRRRADSVPQVFIDGRHIGGSDDLAALDRAGELDALLQPV